MARIDSRPFGLRLPKPLVLKKRPFDKLRANGCNRRFLIRKNRFQHSGVLATPGGLRVKKQEGSQSICLPCQLAEGRPRLTQPSRTA